MNMKSSLFLNAASTICHQPVFGQLAFSADLQPLEAGQELVQPSYKSYIDPVLLRRMSRILRMGVTCSVDALQQAGLERPSGIIVGTGLGCLQDTEKFLQNFLTLEGLIPPTSFILSTHNTVAGQISLSLGCHGYNTTHTQNALSFEMALLDGVLKLEEGDNNLLVGAADEHIPFLDQVAEAWGHPGWQLTSGASFFVLSSSPAKATLAELIDLRIAAMQGRATAELVDHFLAQHGLGRGDLMLVLGSGADTQERIGHAGRYIHYIQYAGSYPTASAFATHYAADFLRSTQPGAYALVVNELHPDHHALLLLKAIEA